MIFGLYEQDIAAVILLGLIANFLFSFLFGWYLTKNIGMTEMLESKGEKKQSWLMGLAMIVPFAKMIVTLYRVAILQLYFLNRGYSHKEYWLYMTRDENGDHR